jgi:hypothetical protein
MFRHPCLLRFQLGAVKASQSANSDEYSASSSARSEHSGVLCIVTVLPSPSFIVFLIQLPTVVSWTHLVESITVNVWAQLDSVTEMVP